MTDFVGIPITHPPGAPVRAPALAASAAARQAATEFESVFLNEMLAPMFEGLSTDGIGGGGDGEQMFRPMLVEQYANAISKSGGIGLAAAVLRELTRLQSGRQAGPVDGADR